MYRFQTSSGIEWSRIWCYFRNPFRYICKSNGLRIFSKCTSSLKKYFYVEVWRGNRDFSLGVKRNYVVLYFAATGRIISEHWISAGTGSSPIIFNICGPKCENFQNFTPKTSRHLAVDRQSPWDRHPAKPHLIPIPWREIFRRILHLKVWLTCKVLPGWRALFNPQGPGQPIHFYF